MRKIIAFATVLSLITIASLCFAQDEFTISGRVEGVDNGTISLEEPNGEIFNVAAKNSQLSGIEVGDSVAVRVAGGWAVSITKTGKAQMKQQTKHVAVAVVTVPSYTPTEIIGEVTLVGGGMLRVRDDSTQMEHEFTASPDKLSDIKTGYRVEVRAINGRALSLIRLGMPMHSESEPSQKWSVTKYPEEVMEPPLPPAPPLHMEERGVPPSTTSAWIPSHWEWNGHQWMWVHGEWMESPRTGAVWAPSHWGWNGHEWIWIPGHWEQ
jgi:hypothetical protein